MPYVYQPRVPGRKRTIFKVAKSEMAGLRRSGVRTGWRRKSRLSALVKKLVRGQAETKYVADNWDKNNAAALPAVWKLTNLQPGAGKFLPMIPRVYQGTDEMNRIGDQITPVGKLRTTLNLAYDDSDLSGHQIKVEIYYGTTKERHSWGAGNPLVSPQFLDNGDGTNVPPGQSRESTMKPIDKRLVTFRKKTIILSKSSGTTGGFGGTSNFSANSGRSYKQVTLTLPCPKKLTYATAGYEYPTNFAPGYFINLSFCDGYLATGTDPSIDSLVNITSRTHMSFKDM